jgi:hypothetical protein
VRSNFVELTPEVFDCNLRIDSISEPLHRETFLPELSIERFVGAILPGLYRIFVRGIDVGRRPPLEDRSTQTRGHSPDLRYFGLP